MDETSRRLVLSVPGVLGAIRSNTRPIVDGSPVVDDAEFDPVPLSHFPARQARMPIAIESFGQYGEWSDSNSALKKEFFRLQAGGVISPAVPPEQYGGWLSYDEYRLSFIGPRGSSYHA